MPQTPRVFISYARKDGEGLPVEYEQEGALRARAIPYQKEQLRKCARIGDLRLYGGVDLLINKGFLLKEHLGSERPFWALEQDISAQRPFLFRFYKRAKYSVEEGVVCKGGTEGDDLWMVKIKTNAYMKRLQEAFKEGWDNYWE